MDTDSRPHVTLLTPLPPVRDDEPPVYARVEQALEVLPGPWRVALAHGIEVGWWIVTVYRDDGFESTLFLDGPLQQTSTYIRDRMADALQRHLVGLKPRAKEPKREAP